MHAFTQWSLQAATLLGVRRWLLILLTLSLSANTFFTAWLLTRSDMTRTVVLSPRESVEYIALEDTVSPNLLERFAVESLNLVLNVTPSSAAYQSQLFLKHVAPESYAELASFLTSETESLLRNHAATAFFPSGCLVDERAKRVCVRGDRRTFIGKVETSASTETACLELTVRSGRLWIASLTKATEEDIKRLQAASASTTE